VRSHLQELDFLELPEALARVQRRLFHEEAGRDSKVMRGIALALTDLMPLYWRDTRRELTEPELAAQRFTQPELFLVSRRRFEASLEVLQAGLLDQARANLGPREPLRPG
jgi:hypothetical protein